MPSPYPKSSFVPSVGAGSARPVRQFPAGWLQRGPGDSSHSGCLREAERSQAGESRVFVFRMLPSAPQPCGSARDGL